MLIKRAVLDRIVSGEIDLLFRRQKRPTVKTGGTLRTQVGMLDIIAVDRVSAGGVTADDATRAGYPTLVELLAFLDEKSEGDIYRAHVRFGGDDPRIVLRENDSLSSEDIDELTRRLRRFDEGRRGEWTVAFLRLIDEHPHVRAPDLAASLGWETLAFKEHVRKLKQLGLTISHSPGYELSPRGRALLAVFG